MTATEKLAKNAISALIDLDRSKKRLVQILADVALILTAFFAAMLLRLETTSFATHTLVWLTVLPTIPVTVVIFRQLGLYRSVLRFITSRAFSAIGSGVFISAIVLSLTAQFLNAPIPRSVPVIYAVLLILGAGGLRFVMRQVLRPRKATDRQSVAIYGAGDAGLQLQNAIDSGREFAAVAFIDDNPSLQGTLVGGRQVFAPSQMEKLVTDYEIKSILLALPSVSRSRRREIIAGIEPWGVEIKTIPGMADIVSGRASFNELHVVSPEDLLGRDPVTPDADLMGRNITGKVVMVSGAGGSIGSELCRQIIDRDPLVLVLFEQSELALYTVAAELRESLSLAGKRPRIEPVLGSVQNPGRVRAVLRAFGVQTIYHAAAYKHVVLVEENVVEGIANNVFGTKVLAEAAADLGVESFTLISTDKAVRPTNVMGASKRMAELVCQSLAEARHGRTVFSMVRFGNVLGSSGSVIPKFRAQIEQGGPVTVTHREITRYFMTIPEASQLVIQAGAMARGGEVFVLDMGEPVKILDLAKTMIRLHGLKPYVIETTYGVEPERGDIGIQIVGLNKGEKLYEELLIGNNPQGTSHPRILSATEISLPMAELTALLDRLQRACLGFDIPALMALFQEAPLAYNPNDAELHDLTWNAAGTRKDDRITRLKAVN
jgi:FlaA1/EpsC-like NDP-sugar epimerase